MSEFYHLAALHSQLITHPQYADLHPLEENDRKPGALSDFMPSFVKDTFNKSASSYVSAQNAISVRVLEPEALMKPIKSFIAEFVRKQLLGWSTQTLGNLLCVFISMMGVDVAAEVEVTIAESPEVPH